MRVSLVIALVIGLIIGFAAGYIILEQRVSRLEAKIAEKDLMIDQFFTMLNSRAALSQNEIVDAVFTLSSSAEHRDFYADLKKSEEITVQLRVMGAPVDFYINLGTLNLMQKTDILSEDFNWTVPEDGRYVFRTQLKGEYALINLRVYHYWGMIGGGTAAQEKIAIQAVQCTTLGIVTVHAKSTGGSHVTITEAILRDSAGLVAGIDSEVDVTLDADGTLEIIECQFTGMETGKVYTVTLVSKAGNQFVSPSFKAP